jgi:hypothetical protein
MPRMAENISLIYQIKTVLFSKPRTCSLMLFLLLSYKLQFFFNKTCNFKGEDKFVLGHDFFFFEKRKKIATCVVAFSFCEEKKTFKPKEGEIE